MKLMLQRRTLRLALSVITTTTMLIAVAEAPVSAASSDCASGYMCLWTGTSYTGTIKRVSTSGTNVSVGLNTVGSYYNHRSQRVFIREYSDGSGRSLCVNPGTKVPATSGWLTRAQSVYLSSSTFC